MFEVAGCVRWQDVEVLGCLRWAWQDVSGCQDWRGAKMCDLPCAQMWAG